MRAVGVFALLAIVLAAGSTLADIKPVDTTIPLFRIFAPAKIEPGEKRPLVTTSEKPLLVVWSVADLFLAGDQKGVLITLTPKDAKAFAAITRKHNRRLLIFEAEGRVFEAWRITAPIVDGIIGFKHPDHGAAAEYLRRRFRIAEFE